MANGTQQNASEAEAPADLKTRPSERDHRALRDFSFSLVLVLAIWTQLFLKLRIDWSTNAQYEFGPFVPFFVIFLLFQRFADRPPAKPFRDSTLLIGIVVTLLLSLLPLRLIQEANPDWRPLNWVHATIVTILTLAAAAYFGGWRWLRHFAPPLILIFFALPWPLAIEQSVIQSLARAVAAITTELLNLADVPALQDGNVIRVPTGPVGVQDACSGVRSLAGTLMAAYFFGEFYRLGWLKRAFVIFTGVVIAFILNLVRTFTLGWIAAHQGIEAVSHWHDQTGLLIFCVAFGALWFLTSRLSSNRIPTPGPSRETVPFGPIPVPFLVAVAAWIVLSEVATEGWYRFKERNLPSVKTWTFRMPGQDPSLQTEPVSDQARAILRYSEGQSVTFAQSGYPSWHLYFFQWAPGRSSSQLAVLHRPDICLPAAGLRFISSEPPAIVRFAGVIIPFDCSVFDSQGMPLYVFRTLCEDRRPLGSTSGFDQSIKGRLQSVWAGRRNLGQKLLQVGIVGPQSQQTALADLQARLPQFLAVSE
jgi:exosortase